MLEVPKAYRGRVACEAEAGYEKSTVARSSVQLGQKLG